MPKLGDDTDDPKKPLTLSDDDAAADEPDADADAADGEGEEKPPEYDLQAPEGREPYREAVLTAYKEAAGKAKLTQEQASSLLEAVLPAIEQDTRQAVKARMDAQEAEWQQQLETRYGDGLANEVRAANRTLKRFATKELRQMFAQSPLRANPDFIALLSAVDERFSNDPTPKGNEAHTKRELPAEEQLAAEYDRDAAASRRGS